MSFRSLVDQKHVDGVDSKWNKKTFVLRFLQEIGSSDEISEYYKDCKWLYEHDVQSRAKIIEGYFVHGEQDYHQDEENYSSYWDTKDLY